MDTQLEGKVAIVTGGSRGIGKAIATALTEAGATVMITSRKAEALEEATAEIGGNTEWLAGNVGDPEHAEAVAEATVERLGAIDILINNAATNPYAGPAVDIDLPRWEKTLQINLTAPLVWSQAVWHSHMAQHGGAILNVASVGGYLTSSALSVYNITKAALIHLTKQLAAEMAPGVRVNAVAPGLIKTDFARLLWEGDRGDMVARSYPLKRLGEVTDIAAAAHFLVSPASSWITGQTLVLDGGGLIRFGEDI